MNGSLKKIVNSETENSTEKKKYYDKNIVQSYSSFN